MPPGIEVEGGGNGDDGHHQQHDGRDEADHKVGRVGCTKNILFKKIQTYFQETTKTYIQNIDQAKGQIIAIQQANTSLAPLLLTSPQMSDRVVLEEDAIFAFRKVSVCSSRCSLRRSRSSCMFMSCTRLVF